MEPFEPSRLSGAPLTRERRAQAHYLATVTKIVFENNLNIDSITRLSGRMSLRGANGPAGFANARSALQFEVSGKPRNVDQMREELFKVSLNQPVDIAIQDDDLFRRNRRLILFDMDSTLIQCEVIDELAAKAGVGKQVAEITEAAMRGELDFKESFRQRMKLLKGLDRSVPQGIAESLPVTEGAPRLIANLKRLGYKVGILSGGFTYFAQHLQKKLGIDYVHANELDWDASGGTPPPPARACLPGARFSQQKRHTSWGAQKLNAAPRGARGS